MVRANQGRLAVIELELIEQDTTMAGLFATEIAAMWDRLSTAEIQARFACGLMTYLEVLMAALHASYVRPDIRAELDRQFRSSPDDLIRRLGDGLDAFAGW